MPDRLGQASPAAPVACPSCQEPVARDQSVCPHCGAIVQMENVVSRAAEGISAAATGALDRIPRPTLTRRGLLWILALFPLAVGPAVLALLYMGFLLTRRSKSSAGIDWGWSQPTAIVVVAALNIALSLWFWHALGDAAPDLWPGLRSVFDRLGPSRLGQPI